MLLHQQRRKQRRRLLLEGLQVEVLSMGLTYGRVMKLCIRSVDCMGIMIYVTLYCGTKDGMLHIRIDLHSLRRSGPVKVAVNSPEIWVDFDGTEGDLHQESGLEGDF